MRKIFVVAIGFVVLMGTGIAHAKPKHGSGWSRDYHKWPRHGWHGRRGYWGHGWPRHYRGWRWYGPGWQTPYIVDSAVNAGLAAYAIHEAAKNREINYYYSAPAYPYPVYYPAPYYAPPVSYEPMGSQVVTETVTVVE